MNEDPKREGDHTFAIYGEYDGGSKNMSFWGRITCEYPTMDKGFSFNSPEYNHLALRDKTVEL